MRRTQLKLDQTSEGLDLKPSEYSPTVLGLIFLRYADGAPLNPFLLGAGTDGGRGESFMETIGFTLP